MPPPVLTDPRYQITRYGFTREQELNIIRNHNPELEASNPDFFKYANWLWLSIRSNNIGKINVIIKKKLTDVESIRVEHGMNFLEYSLFVCSSTETISKLITHTALRINQELKFEVAGDKLNFLEHAILICDNPESVFEVLRHTSLKINNRLTFKHIICPDGCPLVLISLRFKNLHLLNLLEHIGALLLENYKANNGDHALCLVIKNYQLIDILDDQDFLGTLTHRTKLTNLKCADEITPLALSVAAPVSEEISIRIINQLCPPFISQLAECESHIICDPDAHGNTLLHYATQDSSIFSPDRKAIFFSKHSLGKCYHKKNKLGFTPTALAKNNSQETVENIFQNDRHRYSLKSVTALIEKNNITILEQVVNDPDINFLFNSTHPSYKENWFLKDAFREKELNILEISIIYGNEASIELLLKKTNWPIRGSGPNMSPRLQTIFPTLQLSSSLSVNSLNILALRFQNEPLLRALEKRSHRKLVEMEISMESNLENIICILTSIPHTPELLHHLVQEADATKKDPNPYLRLYYGGLCKSPPLINAARYGNARDIPILVNALCEEDRTCQENMICGTSDTHKLHMLDYLAQKSTDTATIDFLMARGGHQCWESSLKFAQHSNNTPVLNHYEHYYKKNIIGLTPHQLKQGELPFLISSLLLFVFILIRYIFPSTKKTYRKHYHKLWPHDYEGMLLASVTGISAPREHIGTLTYTKIKKNNASEDSRKHVEDKRQEIYRLGNTIHPFPIQSSLFYAPVFGGIKDQHLHIAKTVRNANKKIIFYIPGTASSIENPDIDNRICSYLSHALEGQVLHIHHRLAPDAQWPSQLQDICVIIKQWCQEHNPEEIILTGYSAGALLATLFSLITYRINIYIDRLILFFPLLDFTGEFRDNIDNKIFTHLPRALQDDYTRFKASQIEAQKDRIFGGDLKGEPFRDMLAQLFPEKHKKNPVDLRNFSPAWYSPSTFKNSFFPETTIITAEQDYFVSEAMVLHHKLIDSGVITQLIVLPGDHVLIWSNPYVLYTAQPIHSKESGTIKIEADVINDLKALESILKQKENEISSEEMLVNITQSLKEKTLQSLLFKPHPQQNPQYSLPKHIIQVKKIK